MSPEIILLILRLVGAALLLAFFGVVAWLLLRDLKQAGVSAAAKRQTTGRLLLLGTGNGTGDSDQTYVLQAVTSIGRSTGNTLVLDDDFASGEHALITLRGQQWWLEDLGSRNGTLLNNIPLDTAAVVASGDIITVGRTRFRIEL
jgi:pSer/pThr/pTyr-binding forkhead associated (FHA) protein